MITYSPKMINMLALRCRTVLKEKGPSAVVNWSLRWPLELQQLVANRIDLLKAYTKGK